MGAFGKAGSIDNQNEVKSGDLEHGTVLQYEIQCYILGASIACADKALGVFRSSRQRKSFADPKCLSAAQVATSLASTSTLEAERDSRLAQQSGRSADEVPLSSTTQYEEMATPGDGPVASVVIPAYNEEARIGKLLSAIACAESGPELEIIVVCNGCTDRTLEIARGFPDVKTVEEPVGSKILALNRGDEVATAFPRIYLDADVLVTREDLIHFVDEIRKSDALAYGMRIDFDTKGASWVVRRYYDFWSQTPYFTANRDVGSGLYALTEEARSRFGRFPTLIADDGYVNFLFDEGEKEVIQGARMVVRAPRRLIGLLKIKARSFAGREQLQRRYSLPSARSNSNTSLFSTALRSPTNGLGFGVFVSVQLVCRLWGKLILLRGKEDLWLRDETART